MVEQRGRGRYVPKPRPIFTAREAQRELGVNDQVFGEASALFRQTVEDWWASGVSRPEWEIPALAVTVHTRKYVEEAQQAVGGLVAQRIDGQIRQMDAKLLAGAGSIARAEKFDEKIEVIEGGGSHLVDEAVELYDFISRTIDGARATGATLHERVRKWYSRAAVFFLVLDAVGVWAVLAGFVNADIARPWTNPLQLTLALFGTATIVVLQVALANIAGQSHNKWRFAAWKFDTNWLPDGVMLAPRPERDLEAEQKTKEEDRVQALSKDTVDRLIRARNWQLVGLGLVTAVASAAILLRAFEVFGQLYLGGFILWTLYTIFGLSPVLMATMLYHAKAADGSELSRQRDQLAIDLTDSARRHAALMETAVEAAGVSMAISGELWDRGFNDVLSQVQSVLDGAIPGYRFGEAQIGCQPVEIQSSKRQFIGPNHERSFGTTMACGIPGADKLDIGLIATKLNALEALDIRLKDLEYRIANCPGHPWTTERSATPANPESGETAKPTPERDDPDVP